MDAFRGERRRLTEGATPKESLPGRLPDFFVCGAARSGTTALWRFLQQHPEIFMPTGRGDKEPGYFSEAARRVNRERYLALFENAAVGQIVGEASGAYLTSPDSAENIARAVPSARIIIMLRNPVDRAFSLYRWMVWHGFEWIGSFRRAIEYEKKRRLGNERFRRFNRQYYYNYLYFNSGLYSEQVARYLGAFSREQVQFVIFEEFVQEMEACVRSVFQHLGVSTEFCPELGVHNEGFGVRFAPLQYLLVNILERPLLRLSGRRGSVFKKGLTALNREAHPADMAPELRAELHGAYREDIQRTGMLIGRNLDALWGG